MLSTIIHTTEHSPVSCLSEEQLFQLLTENSKLVETIDVKKRLVTTGYYIGLCWITEKQNALYVKPKLDNEQQRIDYLKMLATCFEQPEILKYGDDLFEIQFDKPSIQIRQQDDLITPLLIVYFLQIVQKIVRKGLKKGYYKVENNLYATVKGKVLVSKTLKFNTFKNRELHTFCTYDEFGINNSENRIIKKALLFILRYLKISKANDKGLSSILNYILPAFDKVNEDISINEVKTAKHNPFFSEYSKAVEISIIILKRFGFNINFIKEKEIIEVPPFWINMPKIFEFYVLSKLKKALDKNEIIFQANAKYGELDFLRITKNEEIIIDAKYKPKYHLKTYYDINDIRQLSGYGRDKGTFKMLQIDKENWDKTVLNCLIIYPDQTASSDINSKELLQTPINQFEKFYKLGISIPLIKPI